MSERVILTYDDLAALPGDGKRYELHEGEISVSPSPRTRHQVAVGNLHLILAPHVRRLGIGKVFVSPIDVILSNVTVLVPDLVYVDTSRLGLVSERAIEGPPTLVIDADARVIETRQLVAGAYVPGPRLEGDTAIALPPFPDLLLDPAAVWH